MNQEQIITPLEVNRYAWVITVEHDSLLERCAIDSLFFLHKIHGDEYTYATYDKYCQADFLNFQEANKTALRKERLDQFKY